MRVCFVADVGVKISGGHQSLLNLITELKKYGVEPFLVCHKDWELMKKAEEMGINTKVISSKIYVAPVAAPPYAKAVKYIKYPIKRVYNALHLKEVKEFLIEQKIELVHLNSLLSSEVWAKAADECTIPYIWHIREFMEKDHGRYIIHSDYTYHLVRKASHVIAISGSVQKHWEQVLHRSCDLVYNGLSFEKYGGSVEEKFSQDKIHCVIVGRVIEGKGQMDAVKAVERIVKAGCRDFHLTIVGYRGINPYEMKLAEYIRTHGLEEYISVMDYTYDLKEIRQKHDIGLTCSKAEAFGRVTIENMMSGMLAIGTDSGGTAELIAHGKTGFLYTPGDDKQLAEILMMTAKDRKQMLAIAAKGQENARSAFSIERTASSIYKIYSGIEKNKST